ncbi:SsgA family sporulation/cell division regulator [Kitasatospora sp. NPDC058965]|uniref:SsgA family sporulation/cell division regulator n=1 Tax=Kitasatospora sp. NPDC058965 TaxID=3346682 RepID=UPI003678AC18
MDNRTSVVELELELKLVLSPERSVPVPARFSYSSRDPFAVHITFHLDTETPVTWVFSRELLVEGTFRPSGQGDVRIWPAVPRPEDTGPVLRRSVLLLALTSPGGDALLEAPLLPVVKWLERTHRLVPPAGAPDASERDGQLARLSA